MNTFATTPTVDATPTVDTTADTTVDTTADTTLNTARDPSTGDGLAADQVGEVTIDTVHFVDPFPCGPATVEIVVPVYNEEATLARSIGRLAAYLRTEFPLSWVITIADNASTDRTWDIATSLAHRVRGVRAAHLDAKGRGRALRAVWWHSESPVVAYMDVDLSTDLRALLPLVAPLVSDHSDVAIGTRLAAGSRVARGPKREAISRSYNLILRATLHAGFSDAQCGFKAIRADAAKLLLPQIVDNGWFFDTEMLVLAERAGMRIHEVPVDWSDDPDSRVHVVSTATDDLRGVWRMLRRPRAPQCAETDDTNSPGIRPLAEQLVRFASIGAVSTVVFSLLFLALRGTLGTVGADIVAFAACTMANVAAHRRLTSALRGRRGRALNRARLWPAATLPFAVNLIAVAAAVATGIESSWALVALLTVVNAVGTLAKLALLNRAALDRAGSGRRVRR